MSKYSCVCGYVMNLSQGWSDHELSLIPESVIETLVDMLGDKDEKSSSQLYEVLDEKATTVYRCPKCRRLHLEEEPNKFTIYVKE